MDALSLLVLTMLPCFSRGQHLQTDIIDVLTEISVSHPHNVTSGVEVAEPVPTWRQALDYIQLIMTAIGVITNATTIVLLWKAGQRFTSLIRILLQHQSFVDGLICFLAIPILTQPHNWTTGNEGYDIFMCHIWHSQVLFWSAIYVSVWNLVLIAIERYIAVIHPLKHNGFTKDKLFIIMAVMYMTACIVIFTGLMQVRFEDSSCSYEYFFTTNSYEKYMSFYSIYWFFAAYAVPFILFVILYGIIMISLHRRKEDTMLGQSRIIDKASAQFTRTAILVTLFFMVSQSFDAFYYILGTVGVTTYIHGSPLQRVALFFTCMNSVANPFLYGISMPAFRQSFVQLFSCKKYSSRETSLNSSGTRS